MKLFFTIVLLLPFIFSPAYSQWLRYTIDDLNSAMGVDIADIDADGDPDVIATSENENDVFWYENNNLTWQPHVIDTNLGGVIFVHAVDMDGDDDLDLVVNGFRPPIIVWYENNLPDSIWSKHVIDNTLNGCEYIVVADFDNDDDFDVAVTTYDAGEVFWYENDSLAWIQHTIDTTFNRAGSVESGYIDGDNSIDVVVSDNNADDLFWYKNNDNGTSWTKAIIDTNLLGAFHPVIADMDGDGTSDVIATAKGLGEVVWYKNNNLTWQKNTIDNNLPDAHYTLVTDVDGDDDPDVVVTAQVADKVFWYENNLPNLNWPKHLIDGTLDGPRISDAVDFNDDAKPDLVVTGWNANKLVWYHNVIGVAHAYSVQCYPNYISPQGDTLVINTRVSNPENHPLEVHAIIYDEQYTFVDSVQLYDDGQHNDSLAADSIWGNSKWFSGLLEDIYLTEVSVYDLEDDNLEKLYPAPGFTTIGPLVLNDATCNKDTINPGDYVKFEFTLKNFSNSVTAQTITSKIAPIDTFAWYRTLKEIEYGSIAPNGISIGSSKQYIEFSQHCSLGQIIKIPIQIYSQGYHFWTDTMFIKIGYGIIPNAIESNFQLPLSFSLGQNYPNPFNPITNIQFSIPKSEFVTLKIYNLLGQEVSELVAKRLPAGKYQYTWDAGSLASGIYLYHLKAGEFQEVKKIILLK